MRSISLFFALCLVLSSCYDDLDNSVTVVIEEQPKTEMGTKLTGAMINQDGSVEQSYELRINGESHSVDNGIFYIDLDKVYKYGQLVEAYTNGQLIGIAYPYLLENDINKIEIQRLDALSMTSLSNEREIEFGANIKVKVKASNFNQVTDELILESLSIPTDRIFSTFGNSGFTPEGQLLHLESTSAFILNVWDGQAVAQLLEEQEIEMEINAAEGESLFAYNKDLEYWVEVSKLTSSKIKVNQLGYFMIASTTDAIEVETTIQESGQPVSYLKTNISINNNAQAFTTQKGKLSLVMPVLSEAELVFETQCGDVISNYTIVSEDIRTAEEISIEDDNNLIIPVNTRVIDCEGSPSSIQALEVTSDNTSDRYFFDTEDINNRMALCDEEYTVAGYDAESNGSGAQVTWNNTSEDALDVLTNCSDLKDGFSYIMIRDDIKVYESFEVSFENGETLVQSADGKVRFKLKGAAVGQYADDQINIFMEDDAFGEFGYSIPCETSTIGCGITECNVTQLESASGELRISFSGEVHASTIETFQYGGFELSGVIVISE